MANKAETAVSDNGAVAPVRAPRVTKPRAPAGPKTVFAVFQVLDEHGEPMEFSKSRIKVLGFEKDGLAVMDQVETHKHAIHIRGSVQPGR